MRLLKWIWNKTVSLWKWLWQQLKDWRTFVIFVVVFLVLSFEVWGFYLIGFITGNGWWHAAASACWLFWLGPFTPFLPICIGVTLGIKKLFYRKKTVKPKGVYRIPIKGLKLKQDLPHA